MNALALLVVVIVEAGEERMRGGDPCGRLPLFEMYYPQEASLLTFTCKLSIVFTPMLCYTLLQ